MSVKTKRAQVPGLLVTDYLERLPAEGRQPLELVLLLHGYNTRGATIYRELEAAFPPQCAVLAPNGPYPLPRRSEEGGYKLGFSWYFYDFKTDEYFIDMEVAIGMLVGLVEQLGYGDLPKRVIGFSQGGYLAPAVALRLRGVTQVVGIGARFLDDEIALGLPFRLDAIHGGIDEFVSVEESARSHEKFRQAGTRGEFRVIPELGHAMGPAVREALAELLARG